jgi:Transposase DDE domain
VLRSLDWGDPARRLIAIDGKTSKRTGDTRTGQRPLHTLSAYAREQRLVLAQEVVDGKSNEGALIPSLLDKLRLKGSLVTIDAAGSYRPIAGRIVEAGADYLLAVKANQPKLLAGIKAALEQAAPETVQASARRPRTGVRSTAAARWRRLRPGSAAKRPGRGSSMLPPCKARSCGAARSRRSPATTSPRGP